MDEIMFLSAARTAIGAFGGSLRDKTPGELGAIVARAAMARAAVDPADVGHVVFGQVIPTGPRDAYLARVVAIESGMPHETPALTVNRLCGSGMQAVISAAQMIALGDAPIAVAGGAEVMSRAPSFLPDMRWGRRLGDSTVVDGLNGALTDPFGNGLMGVTGENVAAAHGVTRADQDALALESQRRAGAAIREGRFRDQIVAVEVGRKGKTVSFEVDEYVRPDTTPDDLARLKPIFKPDGTVTAGNASGINDGAAAIVLASAAAARASGLRPMARLVSYGHAGVDPALMGLGPIPASRLALRRAGLDASDLDVVEANEAFAAQACAVARELGLDPAKVNPNGSGISLGHPVGATGAIITTKLIHELKRIGGRFGLATMCIGGGQGIALVVENLER